MKKTRLTFRRFAAALWLGAVLGLGTLSAPAMAQSPFSIAVRVNDGIVTNYEIQQRRLFLSLLNAPPQVIAQARETLVNERLQVQAAERLGVGATEEAMEQAVTDFAARANLGPQQFLAALGRAGVAPETLRDFLRAGVSWRNVVRARFAEAAAVSDADIDRALSLNGAQAAGGGASSTVDYATIPFGGSNARAQAQALRDRVDTCDDLYGVRPSGFERRTVSADQIPADVSAALSRLDENEMSYDVVRGGNLLVLMLCSRSAAGADVNRGAVQDALFQQRMQAYAAAYLEELRAEAIIEESDR